jgi:hypothetical protein
LAKIYFLHVWKALKSLAFKVHKFLPPLLTPNQHYPIQYFWGRVNKSPAKSLKSYLPGLLFLFRFLAVKLEGRVRNVPLLSGSAAPIWIFIKKSDWRMGNAQ